MVLYRVVSRQGTEVCLGTRTYTYNNANSYPSKNVIVIVNQVLKLNNFILEIIMEHILKMDKCDDFMIHFLAVTRLV